MKLLQRYQQDLQRGDITQDEEQLRVIGLLDQLHGKLSDLKPPARNGLTAFAELFSRSRKQKDGIQGLYIWGGVGRGKTYLMDLFYESLPISAKRRTHFHRFMQEIHAQLTRLQGTTDPLAEIARQLAGDTKVLCFDEFFVSDIGDAMILAGLLDALFSNGVVLVATSNVEPSNLYENGLQRERFLPAIALLEQHTQIVEVRPGTDYRLERLSHAELFLHPITEETEGKLQQSFRNLAPDVREIQENPQIQILEREIPARYCADDVVWFTFTALCDGPRSAFDYVEIARLFHALILSDVPVMDDKRNDSARRFINLIDELYDRRVKLIVAAAGSIEQLYTGTRLTFEFERTRSRLVEMQSHDYLCREHLA